MPDNPFWYKHDNPYQNIGSATVPDTVGSFQPRYLPQQTGTSYPSENHVIADTASSFKPETLLQPYQTPAATHSTDCYGSIKIRRIEVIAKQV
jgi:hypothetical protein